jgi:hypothetical protein
MLNHPATIEVIERFAYAFKNAGDALHKWAQRLKAEPPPRLATVEDIERLIEQRVKEALAAAATAKKD